MSDDDFFLQAIRAAPEDLQLHAIYADWLEERGDPRAEVLRAWLTLLDATRYFGLARVTNLPPGAFQQFEQRVQHYRDCALAVDASWIDSLGSIRPWISESVAWEIGEAYEGIAGGNRFAVRSVENHGPAWFVFRDAFLGSSFDEIRVSWFSGAVQ